jgi:antitoxin StbD
MQKIRATKTVSMTEMRDPKKVLEFAAGEKVAIMNRDKIVGYFTPADSDGSADVGTRYATKEELDSALDELVSKYSRGLDYLKDK